MAKNTMQLNPVKVMQDKLGLTMPAAITLLAYVIMGIILLLPFEYPVYDERTGKTFVTKYDLGQRLLMVILMTIPVALSVYTVNCLVTGKCMTWSYVIALITVFWVALFVLAAIIYTFSPNKVIKKL